MTYASEVLADSPWGFWEFTETSGTTLADSSGNARSLTITGAPAFSEAGPGADFPGIEFGSGVDALGPRVGSPTAFTLEAWVYFTSTPAGQCTLMGEADLESGASFCEAATYLDAGKPAFLKYESSTLSATAPSALSAGAWHHVVATFASGGSVLYVDGAQAATLTGGALVSNRLFRLHAGPYGPTGVIRFAAPAVYDTALSAARVAAHYSAMTGGGGPIAGTLGATLPAPTAALSGTYAAQVTGTLAATLPRPAGSFTGTYGGILAGTLDATLPSPTSDLAATYTPPLITGTLAATLPGLTTDLTGTDHTDATALSFAIALPALGALTAAITAYQPLRTAPNNVGGRSRTGSAEVVYDPPVEEPPS